MPLLVLPLSWSLQVSREFHPSPAPLPTCPGLCPIFRTQNPSVFRAVVRVLSNMSESLPPSFFGPFSRVGQSAPPPPLTASENLLPHPSLSLEKFLLTAPHQSCGADASWATCPFQQPSWEPVISLRKVISMGCEVSGTAGVGARSRDVSLPPLFHSWVKQ